MRHLIIYSKFLIFLLLFGNNGQLKAKCNPDTINQYIFDSGNKILELRHILVYDNSQHIIQKTTQNWDFTSKIFINFKKINNTYNGSGKIIESITYDWNSVSSNWDNSTKESYTYDANLNKIGSLYTSWNNTTNNWDYFSDTRNTFDSQNNLITNTFVVWNSGTKSWENYYQTSHTYNVKNKETTSIAKAWNNNKSAWDTYTKHNYFYNANDSLTNTLIQTWNINSNDWQDVSRDTLTYDSLNNEILTLSEEWNNGWENSYKNFKTYNSNNQITEKNIQKWNPTELKWENFDKSNYTYDLSTDLFPIDDYYTWDTSSKDYYEHFRVEYSCNRTLANKVINRNIFQIFPNPCSNNAFTINTNSSCSFNIIDFSGRIVQTGNLEIGSNSIMHSLPPGLYFIGTETTFTRLNILR